MTLSHSSETSEQMKLVSLFTGAGGLDLGLELEGFTTVAANEIEAHACETLKANRALPGMSTPEFDRWFSEQLDQKCYTNIGADEVSRLRDRVSRSMGQNPFLRDATILPGDIRQVASADIARAANVKYGELAVVAGGPPCQPFSRAGKREAVDVSNGQLFREFVRVVSDLRPRWFLFENVKGLILTKTDVVSTCCKECGNSAVCAFDERLAYFSGAFKNKMCEVCGSSRTQVESECKAGGSLDIIIREFESIGYTCTHNVLNAADFGVPQLRERLIIVGSRDGEKFHWPTRTHTNSNGTAQSHLFSSEPTSRWVTMREALWVEGHEVYGPLDPERAVLWVKNVVRPHDEPVTWSLDRPSPTIGAHQSAKLALAPDGVPQEQLLRQQWHTLGKRQGDLPPVPVKHSYLSDVELLKLQSFPDYWYLFGTRMQRAFQIGNAVPVELARALGSSLRDACNGVAEAEKLARTVA
jgi:DNA (cytosine-5)-methyltransferase 1